MEQVLEAALNVKQLVDDVIREQKQIQITHIPEIDVVVVRSYEQD